jgi:hypothetical protein
VGALFNNPELNLSGYASIAEVSAFEGRYTLGLAIKRAGAIEICPQFGIPGTITDAYAEE